MATILRGKEKGKQVKVMQWCNDWVTVRGARKTVFSVTAIEFTDEEMFDILIHGNNGFLERAFEKMPHKNIFRRKRLNRKTTKKYMARRQMS